MPSINFNPAGITALMNFNMAQTGLSQTQSRIATGKKVRSSVDDPAVIATSQRLMARKNGVSAGIENSKAANLLLSTADKALSNMQDIMQNMRQIALKASNDATTDEDRVNYQKQIDDYRKELDRIARDTKYKERHLLNGDISSTSKNVDASAKVLTNTGVNESALQGSTATNLIQTAAVSSTAQYDVTFQIKLVANGNSVDAQIFASNATNSASPVTTVSGLNGGAKTINIALDGTGSTSGGTGFDPSTLPLAEAYDFHLNLLGTIAGIHTDGSKYYIQSGGTWYSMPGSGNLWIQDTHTAFGTSATDINGNTISDIEMKDLAGTIVYGYNSGGHYYTSIVGTPSNYPKWSPLQSSVPSSSTELTITLNKVSADDIGKTSTVNVASQITRTGTTDKSISFQVGADAGEEMTVGLNDMSSYGLRINRLDVSKSLTAKNSVSMLDRAIDTVSEERAKIGSMQNRLEVSISNSETYKMNLEGALAQEVDVNYAEEVLQQTIEQVKQQASLAMLTQANQSQQAVLSLLT